LEKPLQIKYFISVCSNNRQPSKNSIDIDQEMDQLFDLSQSQQAVAAT